MTPLRFLQLVWPDQGYYCLATPFTPPGASKSVWAHKVFDTVEDAAAFATKSSKKTDVFFCVHSLSERQVWDPKKRNFKTGELGAYAIRTQDNTCASRALFFDLDVGDAPKFETQAEALHDLKEFCKQTGLPRPFIVSSGGGVHIYWIVNEDIPVEQWRVLASQLKALAQHYKLRVDPMRTTDSASVLRVVGTNNLKKATPRPVQLLASGKVLSIGMLSGMLTDAVVRGNVTVVPKRSLAKLDEPNNMDKVFDGPPIQIKALAHACGQIGRVIRLRGNVSEPEWLAALSAVRLVEYGDVLVHKMSEGHPNYDHAETQAKVDRLAEKGIGPMGCAHWHSLQPEICEACPFWKKEGINNPFTAARRKPVAKDSAVVSYQLAEQQIVEVIPPPPKPYMRTDNGIFFTTKDKTGDEISRCIYEHDLYPLRRTVNTGREQEEITWRVELPRSAPHDFRIPSEFIYDWRKCASIIANHGVYPSTENIKELHAYMVAYIAKLQAESDAEDQFNHLGWNDDKSAFILPDKMIFADQTTKRVTLSKDAAKSAREVKKLGTLEDQVKLMEFYNKPGYVAHQFFILCGLAAPLFHMTGHHGVVVNASGDPGASKSSALYTAASFWGHPSNYPINGTNRGATANGRLQRVTTLSNLPVCIDELTHIPAPEMIDLAMSVTQPGHRIRLNTAGEERGGAEGQKSTIMMTTANTSMHSILATKNIGGTAGSMRVVELGFTKTVIHTKSQADDYMLQLTKNYGHIGEAFIAIVLKHRDQLETYVRKVMREIDEEAAIQPGERFWGAAVATALVACELANKMKLLPYDKAHIRKWAINKLLPQLRGVVSDEYLNPIAVLSDFLEHINEHILVIQRAQQQPNNIALATKMPRGGLFARYNLETGEMWVLLSAFKEHAQKQGINPRLVLKELHKAKLDDSGIPLRIVTQINTRRVLGQGTDLDKGQSYVFIINMNHPEITGKVQIAETDEDSK